MISGISKASAYLLLVLAFTIWILNGLVDDWGLEINEQIGRASCRERV